VRGGKDDPRNDSEHARKQHNVDDESGHDTLPTQHAPLSREAKATPEGWRKGDGALPKFKQWYPGGINAAPAQIEPILNIMTRASIFLRKRMDCRVKPGNDEREPL
jgi:hypothetical protein